MKRIFVALLMAISAALGSPVSAQTVTPGLTPGCSSPPPAYGVVWTASQWIVCLTSLQPFLGYIPLNAGGGTMSGPLGLAPSVTTAAPLNFQLGVAPTSPANGNVWFTSAGMFYRAGGVSIGPLASTTSQTFVEPTFTGTVTFPDASTATSAGFQNQLHLYVARSTDAGGAQVLQVQGNGYVSGGLSIGTTAATTGGIVIANSISPSVPSSLTLGYSSGGLVRTYGATNSTYSALSFLQLHSDGTGSRTPLNIDTSGNAQLTGTTSLGTGSTDYVNASGGASGGAITTNGGTLTISSGAGTGTKLADSVVTLSNAAYSNCSSVGTAVGGALTCNGPVSGFITYHDNVTSDPSPAVTANLYCMNTNAGALNLTLPTSPSNGDYVGWSDCGGNFGVHSLTIVHGSNNIMYNAGDLVVNVRYQGGVLRYSSGQSSWILSPL